MSEFICCPIFGDSPNSVCSRGTKGCVEKHDTEPRYTERQIIDRVMACEDLSVMEFRGSTDFGAWFALTTDEVMEKLATPQEVSDD